MNIVLSSWGGYRVLSTYCGISSPLIAVGGDTNTTSVVVSVVLRAATMEWWVNMVKVAGKMVMMIVFIIIMRIRWVSVLSKDQAQITGFTSTERCIFDPEAKSKLMEKFKAHLKLKVTDENKDILDKTADEDFMFSWNGISVMFKLMLQDANKVNLFVTTLSSLSTKYIYCYITTCRQLNCME